MKQNHTYPFTAIVGQDAFKLALILNVIDPTIGGVLAIGDKGTGKTTLIRSLAGLMESTSSFPFVNLPIGASEDRVLGHIHLEKLINEKVESVQPGLLANANGGLLYVDEINLLNDYLMDVLLDASASGNYYLEREGISKRLESRFCLVGSMNPEEGNLRPQLKDRFGLSVFINTPQSVSDRAEIIQRRMTFDDAPDRFITEYQNEQNTLRQRITFAKQQLSAVQVPAELYHYAAELAVQHNVEGVRADILLIKTARAFASFNDKSVVNQAMLDEVAHYVFNHRKRPSNKQEQQEQKKDNPTPKEEKDGNNTPPSTLSPKSPNNEIRFSSHGASSKKGMESNNESTNTHHSSTAPQTQVDVKKTVGQYLATDSFEIKKKKSVAKSALHLILILDSSGSMMKNQVITYAKGLIEKTVKEYPSKRVSFSLIAMLQNDAKCLVERTNDTAEIIQAIQDVSTGGKTNVIAAFKAVKSIIAQQSNCQDQLLIITDGLFSNQEMNPSTAYQLYCKGIQDAVVVDAEKGAVKLGMAKTFSEQIRARYEPLSFEV